MPHTAPPREREGLHIFFVTLEGFFFLFQQECIVSYNFKVALSKAHTTLTQICRPREFFQNSGSITIDGCYTKDLTLNS